MRARVFDGTDRRPRQSRIRVLLVIGIGMAWAWAWAWGIAVYAQPAPERVQRGRARTVASRELGRKLAASIDAGDSYPSANGSQHLRRVPGRLALPLSTADASLAKRGGPGRPLAGYRVAARPARMLAILETTGTEVERQRRDPGVLRETLRRARAGGGMGPVNPVFLDPHSGLELLATEQVVIALRPGTDAARYFGRGWKQVRPVWGAADQFLLTLPQATAEEVFAEVGRRLHDAAVVWAEPDFIRQGIKASTPSDPDFSLQWHLYNTGQGGGRPRADARLPEAWDLTTGRPGVVVGVLDDGCQISHPELAPNLFLNTAEIPDNGIDDDHNGLVDDFHGYDFIGNKADPSPVDPEDSHGTAVSGLAVAAGNNGQGGVGAAFGCQLLPVKVIEGDYFVTDSMLAAALRYLAGLNSSGTRAWRGADVVNISLTFGASFVVSSALTDLATRGRNGLGCPIFAAAGNGAAAWQPYQLVIDQPGRYTLRWEYEKDQNTSDGDDTVWLDGIVYPDGQTESFESGGLPPGWTTGGNVPWTNVVDGVNRNRALTGWDGPASHSLRAGRIGSGQVSYVELTTNLTVGNLQFWAWISSERQYDFFRFLVNGEEVFSDSGVPILETAVGFPASHSACFAVGASTDFDYRSDYSQYGVALDFLAPSDGGIETIFTTDRTGLDGYNSDFSPAGDYVSDFGGTSAATPLASGIAALVLSVNPNLSSGEMRALLRGTCDRVGSVAYDAAGRNAFYGSGRINAAHAVAQARDDLQVTLVPDGAPTEAGELSSYKIIVRNLGPSRSGTIQVTNVLPAGVALATAAPAPLTRSGNRVTFSAASLVAGASTTFQVNVTNLVAGTNSFAASAASDVLEVNLANNGATVSTVVYPTPVLSINDGLLVEGNSGTTNLLFEVSLSNPSAKVVSVSFLTASNTAMAGSDFRTTRGLLTFHPGETNKVITVGVVGDRRNEADELFSVLLTNAVRATLGRAAATGMILNDDPMPSLRITNVVVKEGDSGFRAATFKVLLSAASGRAVTVDYATAPGSALAGMDFVPTNGTLVFPPGKVSAKIVVSVYGDRVQESNLTFTVNLSNPGNAVLATSVGVGTILNNDKPPALSIGDLSVAEGDAGTTNAIFTVRLSLPSGLPVSVEFATTNGSASGGLDFMATNGLIAFAPGETNQSLAVPVLGDRLSESNETFFVRLFHPTNAVLGSALGRATILDDDPLPVVNVFGPNGTNVAIVAEPRAGTTNAMFAVELSTASGRTVLVKYATTNGTAKAGADFAARSGTLRFAPGTTNQTVTVTVNHDALVEPDESFGLNLLSSVNATLGIASALVIISDGTAPLRLAEATEGLILAIDRGADGLRLSCSATPGSRYRLERADSIMGPWRPLGGKEDVVAGGATVEFFVALDSSRSQAFFRVALLGRTSPP